MRCRASAALVLAFAWTIGGCGSAPRAAVASAIERGRIEEALDAYDRFRDHDGADVALLAQVAALVLQTEALGEEPERRRAAIQELALAGTAGEPVLRRVVREGGAGRVLALEVLARRGDASARTELRGLADDEDPETRAAAILAMDRVEDRELLLEAVASPFARIRERACERLGAIAPDREARMALEHASRVDPDPSVRGAAVRALGAYGEPAVSTLRERLGDPTAGVRMAAVEALLRADRAQARVILGALLEMPTSAQGIEAARLLAAPTRDGTPGDLGARAYLRQALFAGEASLRAQAGVALVSIPGSEEMVGPLREALERERDPGVRLSLARALLRQPGAQRDARAALRALMRGGTTMTALQAATVLAAERDADAIAVLAAFLSRPDPALRRVAARSLARDAMRPDDARLALRDDDPSVRIAAAGGILAASAAS
jgi:HEAT repeat protein